MDILTLAFALMILTIAVIVAHRYLTATRVADRLELRRKVNDYYPAYTAEEKEKALHKAKGWR